MRLQCARGWVQAGFKPRRKNQRRAEVLRVFVGREAGAVGCQFEEGASKFAKVDGLEPEPVDLLRRLQSDTLNQRAQRHFFFAVTHPPCRVMDGARASASAYVVRYDVGLCECARRSVDAIAVPAVLFADLFPSPRQMGRRSKPSLPTKALGGCKEMTPYMGTSTWTQFDRRSPCEQIVQNVFFGKCHVFHYPSETVHSVTS